MNPRSIPLGKALAVVVALGSGLAAHAFSESYLPPVPDYAVDGSRVLSLINRQYRNEDLSTYLGNPRAFEFASFKFVETGGGQFEVRMRDGRIAVARTLGSQATVGTSRFRVSASDCVENVKPATCTLRALTPNEGRRETIRLVWKTGPRAGEVVNSIVRDPTVDRRTGSFQRVVRTERAEFNLRSADNPGAALSASGKGISRDVAAKLNQVLTCDNYDWLPQASGSPLGKILITDWTREAAAANGETMGNENRVIWAAQGVELERNSSGAYRIESVGHFVGASNFPWYQPAGEKSGWTVRKDAGVCEVFFESIALSEADLRVEQVSLTGERDIGMAEIDRILSGDYRQYGPFRAEFSIHNLLLLTLSFRLTSSAIVGNREIGEVLIERELQ